MLKAGFAVSDITPTSGEDLCGFAARNGKTLGIHDHLYSKWLCLDDGSVKILLSSNDLVGLSRNFVANLRKDIELSTTMSRHNVFITVSHTHSGPATVSLRGCGTRNTQYVAHLGGEMREAATKAVLSRQVPVEFGVAAGTADISRNRRDPERGVVDRSLGVIALRNARTKEISALLCNYACHGVVMGEHNYFVSGDFASVMQARVEKETGSICLFLNGACGDINPRTAHSADFNDAERIGRELAENVLCLIRRLRWCSDSTEQQHDSKIITTATHTINLPVHLPKSVKEIKERFAYATTTFNLSKSFFSERLERIKQQIKTSTYPKSIRFTASLLTLGSETAIVFLPGEVFAEIGIKIKNLSPFKHTFVITFANGCAGYIPTRAAYAAGGYEPFLAPLFYGMPEYEPSVENALLSGIARLFSKSART